MPGMGHPSIAVESLRENSSTEGNRLALIHLVQPVSNRNVCGLKRVLWPNFSGRRFGLYLRFFAGSKRSEGRPPPEKLRKVQQRQ